MSYRGMGVAIPTYRGSKMNAARALASRAQLRRAAAGLGYIATPAQEKAYWNEMAQACTQMADEGTCLARVARHAPVTITMAGLGQTGGAPLGMPAADFRTDTDSRYWQIDAHWVQRAINAWRAQNAARGALIYVDGQSGPITLAALNAISPGLPVAANVPSTSRVAGWVAVAKTLAQQLAALPSVSDPPRPSSSSTTSTTVARSTSTSPSTGVKPGAGAATDTSATVGTAADGQAVLMDEGSSSMPAWLVPALVAGGVAVAGGVGYYIYRSRKAAPAKNRGKRRRRK